MRGLLISCFLLFTFQAHGQETIEITIGAGYTAIDLDQLIEEDEVANTRLNDWDQTNYMISAQYFFKDLGKVTFGVEAAYQYLYWYEVRVPFVPSPIIRSYDVSAFRIAPLFRFGNGDTHLDLGPTFNFSDGLEPGIMVSGNQYFKVSDKIDIPVKVRLDIASGIVFYAPISLNAGVRIRL